MTNERFFRGRNTDPHVPIEALSTVSRAALGQYTLERLMAYGLSHADAMELRGRVSAGEPWRDAALDIASTQLKLVGESSATPSKANLLYRSSAMTRIAQTMMVEDTDERRSIFADAADLFGRAAAVSPAASCVGPRLG